MTPEVIAVYNICYFEKLVSTLFSYTASEFLTCTMSFNAEYVVLLIKQTITENQIFFSLHSFVNWSQLHCESQYLNIQLTTN